MKSLKIYKEIMKDSTLKGKRSLENIKRVCDFLESKGIGINIAMVSRELERQGIGPKEQTIRNNKKVNDYVIFRGSEQVIESKDFEGEGRLIELLKAYQRENNVLRSLIKDSVFFDENINKKLKIRKGI